jgi:hypothetical protein
MGHISPDVQDAANKLVFLAAIAAQQGHIDEVMAKADAVQALGLNVLADKIRRRFKGAFVRQTDLQIVELGEFLRVKTPFRRGAKAEFIEAWRAVPGRRFDRATECNVIPKTSKVELWGLLCKFFPGKYGVGPKGVFRVPVAAEVRA